MRKKPLEILEKYRYKNVEKILSHYVYCSTFNEGNTGVFEITSKERGKTFFIISSIENNWEHVSIYIPKKGRKFKIPTWNDMCYIKNLFWEGNETVVQFHPKESSYVNDHPGTLHLWKKVNEEYELPPENMV